MSDWNTADKLPDKDGTYLIAYIRNDGIQRQGRAFYRAKEQKKYYKDDKGREAFRTKKAGWNISKTARMVKLLAWRNMDGLEYGEN